MEAIRIIKKIDSVELHELEQYKGQEVEIIIFPVEKEAKEKKEPSQKKSLSDLYGVLPDLEDGMKVQEESRKNWEK